MEGVRFEVPARYRHFRDVVVRYARWDLGRVDLVDPRSGATLTPLYPLDRTANADGRRSVVAPPAGDVPADAGPRPDQPLPPLLKLSPSNRWGGFKALRERWTSTRRRC